MAQNVIVGTLLLLLSVSIAAPAKSAIVVSSSGPAARIYPNGTPVDPGATIVLGPGDTVVILTERGTRRFEGPGTFAIADERQTSTAGIGRVDRQERVAGTWTHIPPEAVVFYIPADQGGAYCRFDGLRHYNYGVDRAANPDAEFEILEPGGDEPLAQLDFDGDDLAPLPRSIWELQRPFDIRRIGAQDSARIEFVDLGEVAPGTSFAEIELFGRRAGCRLNFVSTPPRSSTRPPQTRRERRTTQDRDR